ncbi:MAG: hypothetical protein MI685_00735 [Chlorobiales bacterium]|nr:hypothetical protein [Chlorobiales bacterium]
MDVSDSPHILSDDRIVTEIRAIIRQELARALDVWLELEELIKFVLEGADVALL